MSVKRGGKRYVGFRFEPAGATRRQVAGALDAAWRRTGAGEAGGPRLLVCQSGAGILVVERSLAPQARAALEGAGEAAAVRLTPLVTSGTIASVKARLHVEAPPRGVRGPGRPSG